MRLKLFVITLSVIVFLFAGSALAEKETFFFPSSIKAIGEEAFAGDNSLNRVVLPDGLIEIGKRAFAESSVNEIVLPDSVTSIASDAFENCSAGLTFIVNEGGAAETWCIQNNMHCTYPPAPSPESDFIAYEQSDGGCTISDYRGTDTDVRIPERIRGKAVTQIADGAFREKNISSVSIPKTVEKIGPLAFYDCHNLESVYLTEGLKSISGSAFGNCTALKEIFIPGTVKSMGSHIFSDCSSLTSITLAYGITEIPRHFLDGCSALESMQIPASVTKISSSAFRRCSSLKDIVLPEGLTELGEGVFQRCSSLETMVIPYGITELPKNTFAGCSVLTNVILPKTITAIGDSAFSGASSLTYIDIPSSVSVLGSDAFASCGFITLILPEGITELGEGCFEYNTNLEDIVLPSSLRTIGYGAFSYCNKLVFVVLPDGLTTINQYAFSGCESLSALYIPASVTDIGGNIFAFCANDIIILTERNCYGLTFAKNYDLLFVLEPNAESDFKVTKKNSTECIISGYKGSATDVVIPDTIGGRTVTGIAASAFKGKKTITSISALNYVTSIGKYAFQNCTALTHLQLNYIALESMPENSVSGCSKLKTVIGVEIQ